MKKTKRLAVVMGLLLLLAAVTTAVPAFAATSGGWTVSKARYSFLTKGQKKTFNKAVQGMTGVTYKPTALLAKQVVAGTNYVYLCQGTTAARKPVKAWYILKVNKDLKNKVSLISTKKIKLSKVKTAKNPRKDTESGGLEITAIKNKPKKALSKSVRKIFSKGTKSYVGYELRPIALLGTQVVAGKNYKFLCYGTGYAGKDLFVVDIYKDLKGKCSISSVKPLRLEKYVN